MYIRVSVTPGAKKESFTKVSEDSFTITVKEKAKQNAANRRVLELVARHFKVTPGKVHIVAGHRSPRKILDVSS